MKNKIENFIQCEKFNEFELEHAFWVGSDDQNIPIKGTCMRLSANNRKMYEVRYKLLNVALNGNDLIPSYLFERVFDKK